MTVCMDVIDGTWIRSRLPDHRGAQKEFADAIGLTADVVTKILNGSREVKAREIPRILKFFNERMPSGLNEPAPRFAPAPFAKSLKASPAIASITRAACPEASRPFHFIALRSEPLAGILLGDIIILEHGGAKRPGELVLISKEGENGEGENELRRHLPPHLASLDLSDPQPVLSETAQNVGIIGRVAAVIRAPALTTG